ncbi:hypothetical protein [Mycobacterium sp.]|uniref:hypothetical protein n=1 Tax=Mycobacterium sp. TaxID=1785 RepID=UPI003F9BCF35
MTTATAIDRLADLTYRNKVPMPLLDSVIKHEHARIDLCWHEAGHSVAAVVFGGQLCSATVTDGERQGDTLGHPTGLTTLDLLPPGRAEAIAYAGPYSQVRGRMKRRPTRRELTAAFDGIGREDRDALCAAGGSAMGSDVVPLLERCFTAVGIVAKQLFSDNCVTHADVCKALGIPASDNGIERSTILSGSSPGSFVITRPVA